MPLLNLIAQPVDELSVDDNVTELSISQQWIDMHTVEEIQELHENYNKLDKLDISGINIGNLSLDKVKAIVITFPKISKLVINQEEKMNEKLIPELMKLIPAQTELSFYTSQNNEYKQTVSSSSADQEMKHNAESANKSTNIKTSSPTWSYFSPTSWFQPTKEVESVQHHDTTRIPFDLTNFNKGKNNILADWNRAFNEPVVINHMSIKNLVSPFKNLDELRKFFKSHLLLKLDLNKIDTKRALDYLMEVLHQGGLQHPVAAPLYVFMSAQQTGLGPVNASNMVNGVAGQRRALSFTATDIGFTVTETITQNRLVYDITAGDKAGDYLLPDDGKDYVLEMTATISVSWTGTSSTPTVTIGKNRHNLWQY